MIRLARPGLFLPCFAADPWPDEDILVRPTWLSICAADQRYFAGDRPEHILRRKLPMALLHEAVGEILWDPAGLLPSGAKVALVPCAATAEESVIAPNYREGSEFHSSTRDGFAQEMLPLPRDQLIPLPEEEEEKIYVFAEMVSVCVHAITRWRALCGSAPRGRVGVWGDGSLGYLLALTLKALLPETRLTVFGRHDEKLAFFSFADHAVNVAAKHKHTVDHAFECVGGDAAALAIQDIVERLTPQGTVCLLGVSETPPLVPTRRMLEKGLTLVGCSRSAAQDFTLAVELIRRPETRGHLHKIISEEREIRHAQDLEQAFRLERTLSFKSLLEWRI